MAAGSPEVTRLENPATETTFAALKTINNNKAEMASPRCNNMRKEIFFISF
jgi:hypothetical protein